MDDLILSDSPDHALFAPQETPSFDEIRHGFELEGRHYLLAAGVFSELASRSPICPLPDSPPWFAGFINHRGHTVPVFDLPCLASEKRSDQREPYWILLLDQQPHTAGFLLNRIPGVVTDPERVRDALEESPSIPKPLQPFLRTQYRALDTCWHELDHQELLKQLKKAFYQPASLYE
jgi:chemotaxis signal transduction protein